MEFESVLQSFGIVDQSRVSVVVTSPRASSSVVVNNNNKSTLNNVDSMSTPQTSTTSTVTETTTTTTTRGNAASRPSKSASGTGGGRTRAVAEGVVEDSDARSFWATTFGKSAWQTPFDYFVTQLMLASNEDEQPSGVVSAASLSRPVTHETKAALRSVLDSADTVNRNQSFKC